MEDEFCESYGAYFYALQEQMKDEKDIYMLERLYNELLEFAEWAIELKDELIPNKNKKYTLKQLRQAWAAGRLGINKE